MYLEHWGLQERPFQNTYNPAYLYKWEGHREVLSRLRYNLEGGRGMILVSGPTGCGKSFLCRYFADEWESKGTRVCMIVNPIDEPEELLHQIRVGLEIEGPTGTRTDLIRSIDEAARESARQGQRTMIVLDDAHLLAGEPVARALRHLLNLEERGEGLITLILSGQDPVGDRFQASAELGQRIAIRSRVEPLPSDDVGPYISLRLRVAGRKKTPFEGPAIKQIISFTEGVPRSINDLCDVALFAGWGQGKKRIDAAVIQDAIEEVAPAGKG